jgi:tRNA nucleotidyltransferase/poly(A) polymerase
LESKLLIEHVRACLPPGVTVYLVGGAVRDHLLNRLAHDLDFAVIGDTRQVARKVADRLNANLFMLDDERATVRVIYRSEQEETIYLDFVMLAQDDLETDLRLRDYTINAMALNVAQMDELSDPCGGLADLRHKRLRICSPEALLTDPLRVLRGIRQSVAFQLSILPETAQAMRTALPFLPRVSVERQRDELFKMLEGSGPATCLRLMDTLGILPYLLPELESLKGISQTVPHIYDAWEHSLKTVDWLDILLNTIIVPYQENKVNDLVLGLAAMRLGRFREKLRDHFNVPFNTYRGRRGVMMLAALYHDIAKPGSFSQGEDGQAHFYGHDQAGANLVKQRGQMLLLSHLEVTYLHTVAANHMRIHQLAALDEAPTRRAVYRFFRDTGPAGVDLCLLSLADTLATYGPTLPIDLWKRELDVALVMLEAWWERPVEAIQPEPLVRGDELMAHFGLRPGPLVGQLLEILREAQAAGEVQNHAEALALMKAALSQASKSDK